MTNLTHSQLDRIRDGATLVAVPMEPQPTREPTVSLNPQHGYAAIWCRLKEGRSDVDLKASGVAFCPFIPNAPIDPSLPGLVWGKARAVQCGRLTDTDATSLCGDKKTWMTLGYLMRFRKELGDDADWLWLVPLEGVLEVLRGERKEPRDAATAAPERLGKLATEMATYERYKAELLEKHAGKWVVIKDHGIVGTRDTYESALELGYEKCGWGRFAVKEILAVERVHRM